MASRVAFAPLGAVLSGTATLSGHVYVYEPAGSIVGWWVDSSEGTGSGRTTVADDGAYTLTDVAPASGNGGVWAAPSDWRWEVDYTHRTWPDASVSVYDFSPQSVLTHWTKGGPWWDPYQEPWLTMTGSDAGGDLWSYSGEPIMESSAYGVAMPGTYTDFCLNFWSNEGVELSGDVVVLPEGFTSTDLVFNQKTAQRLWEVYSYTASGDPGTVVKLRLQNFPAGEVTDFYGYQYEPERTPYRSFGSYTARDVADQYRKVTIPSTARPGLDYVIGGQHRGGLLDLEVYFQVTRLKGPSSASGSYRLTGQVPIRGYDGSPGDTGTRKYAYLFRRFSPASQPKGDPTKYGWKFIKRYQTSATGRFTTSSTNPGRTAWYVVYYPGDKDNWGGFTSVRCVRHR